MDTNYHIIPAIISVILLILGKCWMQDVNYQFKVTAARTFCNNIQKFQHFFNIRDFERVVKNKEILNTHFKIATDTCNSSIHENFTSFNVNNISGGMIAVQTYVNCKFLTIMTKLMETVELLMECLIKTIAENRSTSKNKLDTANTQTFGMITQQLFKFQNILHGMYFVLDEFELKYIVPDDQSYVTKAVQMMHLYINRKTVPPMNANAEVDDKIRRIRYIHLQVQELIDQYEPVNCNQIQYNPFQGFYQQQTLTRDKWLIKEGIDQNYMVDKDFLDECFNLLGHQISPKYLWVINKTDMSQYTYIKCMWDGIEMSVKEIRTEVISDYRPSSVFKFNNLTVDILFAYFFSHLQSYMNVYLERVSNRKSKTNNITDYDNPQYVMNNLKLWINRMFEYLPDGDPSLSDIHARLHIPNQVLPETMSMSVEALYLVISTRLNIYINKIDLKIVNMDIINFADKHFFEKLKELESDIEKVLDFVSHNTDKENNIILNDE